MRIGPFGLQEIAIILLVLLLIFGARRLPEVGSSLGKSIQAFKRGFSEKPDPSNQKADHVEASYEEGDDTKK